MNGHTRPPVWKMVEGVMPRLILMVAVVLIALTVLALIKAKLRNSGAKADVYFPKKSLFTPAERSFLGVLETVLPANIRVFGKVGLDDILGVKVKSGLGRGEWQAAQNRINRKHVDFLLVRADDLAPLAGIELDDSSHEAEDRKRRDAFVDSAFASAGLPLLHFPAQKSYNPSELKAKLAEMLPEV